MADRVYTEPNRFHPSIHATLAAALQAEGDGEAAARSWARAKVLLDAMPDPPPSTARWVEEVRTGLCAGSAAPATICGG